MAEQEKVNPIFVNEARHFNGKSVTAVTIDAASAILVVGEYAPGYAVELILKAITQAATPILMSAIASDQTFDVYFEGDFQSMSEFGAAGTATFAAYLQEEIRLLGATAGPNDVDLTAALVTFQTTERYGLVGDKF